MKHILLLFLIMFLAAGARAHGGEDHGAAASASAGGGATSFSVAALSEKFELLLRFEPLEKGQDAHMRLFVSDYATNAPIKSARLTVTCPEAASLRFAVTEQAAGTYLVEGAFPENKSYSLAVTVVAGNRADLMLLAGIEVGKKLPVAEVPAVAPSFFSSRKNLLLLLGAFVLGIAATALLMRRSRSNASVPASTPAVYEKHA